MADLPKPLIDSLGMRHACGEEIIALAFAGDALLIVAGDASVTTVRGRYGQTTDYLWFTVNGHRVEYASDSKGYDQLIGAVRTGVPLTVGVSTKRETLLPRQGWVPLYSLAIGTEPLLTYHDTVTKGYRGSNAPFIVGGVLTAISLYGLGTCHRNRNAPRTQR